MRTSKSLLRRLLFLFALYPSVAFSQAPVSDDTFSSADRKANYGDKDYLAVQGPGSTAFIRFDLSRLPQGITGEQVNKATVRLWVSAVTHPGSFDVVRVASSWSEDTLTGINLPLLGMTDVRNVQVAKESKDHYLVVDVTDLVRDWVNNAQMNYGIALVPVGNVSVAFDSKENSVNSHDAELDVQLEKVGPMGPQGPQGSAGLVGPAGPVGVTGPQGPTGPQGAQGPKGDAGATGAQGPAGSAGAQGVKGDTGATGLQGPQGVPGPLGPIGATGAVGPAGPIGATGPQGPTGPQGAQGLKGDAGVTGSQGPAGPAGPQGVPGQLGPTGATGAVGATGPMGATGPQGPAGPQGAQGPKGDTGATGAQGLVGPAGPQGTAVLPYPDNPPATPSVFDDEFNSGTSLKSLWVGPNGTVADGENVTSSVAAWDVNRTIPDWLSVRLSNPGGASFVIQQSSVPSGPFSCTMKFSAAGFSNFMGVYLYFMNGMSGAATDGVRPGVEFNPSALAYQTVQATFSTKDSGTWTFTRAGHVIPMWGTFYLHVKYDGTNWRMWISPNAVSWFEVTSGSYAKPFNVTAIDISMKLNGAATDSRFGVDWIRFNWLTLP